MSRSGAEVDVRPRAATGTPPSHKRRRILRRLILGLVAAAVVTGSFAAIDALAAARELHSGRTALRALTSVEAISASGLADRIDAAAVHVHRGARRASSSPWLRLWSRVPLLGRHASWVRDVTAQASAVTRDVQGSARRVEPALANVASASGRVAALDVVAEELARLDAAASRVRLDGSWLLPPARGAHRRFVRDVARLRAAARDGAAAASGLRSFLAGPRRYLVLAANNAEMRSGGMVLQVGIVETMGGRVLPGSFHSTAGLNLSEPVAVGAQLESLYGWLDPGGEWRNTGSSPNFPAVAPVYAAMAERAGFGRVDGVLQIDVVALAHLLHALGPVTVEGVRYTSANVKPLVLHDGYGRFAADHDERRLGFSRLAVEAFHALDRGGWTLASLARSLEAAVGGRNLLAWSRVPVDQAAWEGLGADGRLDPNGLLVTIQNHGGNKLDWFLRPSASIEIVPRPGGWRRVSLMIDLNNMTPADQVGYVAGDGRRIPVGTYRAFVATYLPRWAVNVSVSEGRTVAVGEDGPMRVVGVIVDVPRGEAKTVVVTFSAPPGRDHLVLLPSARARAIPFLVHADPTDDAKRRIIAF